MQWELLTSFTHTIHQECTGQALTAVVTRNIHTEHGGFTKVSGKYVQSCHQTLVDICKWKELIYSQIT